MESWMIYFSWFFLHLFFSLPVPLGLHMNIQSFGYQEKDSEKKNLENYTIFKV